MAFKWRSKQKRKMSKRRLFGSLARPMFYDAGQSKLPRSLTDVMQSAETTISVASGRDGRSFTTGITERLRERNTQAKKKNPAFPNLPEGKYTAEKKNGGGCLCFSDFPMLPNAYFDTPARRRMRYCIEGKELRRMHINYIDEVRKQGGRINRKW